MRYLPLIAKNCWRNRRRTVLTVLGVAISMCLLGVMVTTYRTFYLSDPTPDQARRLVVRNRIAITAALPQAYESRILRQPGVRDAMISKWFGGTYKDSRDPRNQFARFMVEPEKLFTIYREFRIPDYQKRAFERDRAGCVIGRDLANALGFRIGDRMHLIGDIFPGDYDLNVRGIFDGPGTSNVLYFNKEYVEQSWAARQGAVGTGTVFWVRIDSPADASRVAEAIDAEFRNSPAQTKTESEQAFLIGFISLMGNIKMFLAAISAALLFTLLLVCANTMAMSVRERVREVGILKTLGFTPGAILGLILGEAVSIAVSGGLIGFLISAGLLEAAAKSPYRGYLPPVNSFEPVAAVACIAAAACLGFASSLVAALGVSRMPIVAALRGTD